GARGSAARGRCRLGLRLWLRRGPLGRAVGDDAVDRLAGDLVAQQHVGALLAADLDDAEGPGALAGPPFLDDAGLALVHRVVGLADGRSEEHTSALQSRQNLVWRLLREK